MKGRLRLRDSTMRDYLESLIIAVALGLILRIFVFSPYKIYLDDMSPTLLKGDYVVGYSLAYGFSPPFFSNKKIGDRPPQINEVVVFQDTMVGHKMFIRRIVALPGDRVQILDGNLLINEKIAKVLPSKLKNQEPFVVPPLHAFGVADNIMGINNAPGLGLIPFAQIKAQIWKVWMSVSWKNRNQFFPDIRWSRLFDTVH